MNLKKIFGIRKIKYSQVFYNGVPLKKIAVGTTWFERFMYKLTLWTRRTVIASFILGAIFGAFKIGTYTTSATVSYAAPVEIDKTSEMFKQKIEKMKMDVVEQIRKCEQAHYKESDGLITFDPLVSDPSKTARKDVPSLGTLQFKQSTVVYYYKVLYGKVINGKEAAMIAFDDEKAGQLAKDIMFSTNKKANDWLNCANKLNVNAQIDLIKNLEK
jgi:hypothetical protein